MSVADPDMKKRGHKSMYCIRPDPLCASVRVSVADPDMKKRGAHIRWRGIKQVLSLVHNMTLGHALRIASFCKRTNVLPHDATGRSAGIRNGSINSRRSFPLEWVGRLGTRLSILSLHRIGIESVQLN